MTDTAPAGAIVDDTFGAGYSVWSHPRRVGRAPRGADPRVRRRRPAAPRAVAGPRRGRRARPSAHRDRATAGRPTGRNTTTMTDYPREWLDPANHRSRRGPTRSDPTQRPEFLDPWQPDESPSVPSSTTSTLQYVSCAQPMFNTMFLRFSSRLLPGPLLASGVPGAAGGCSSRPRSAARAYELTIARLRGDLKAARAEALEEMQQ